MKAANDQSQAAPRVTRFRAFLRWSEHLLAAVGLLFIIYRSCFELSVITSDSMAPALKGTSYENGDRVLLERVTTWFRAPRRWEIYHYIDSDGNAVAKRIVGLPHERVSMRNHRIFINGKELPVVANLRSIKYYDYGSLANGREVDCGDGYFMLGDASIDSHDSRFTGPVTRDRFRSRAWCVLWPPRSIAFVK
jgi:signal peptidase I